MEKFSVVIAGNSIQVFPGKHNNLSNQIENFATVNWISSVSEFRVYPLKIFLLDRHSLTAYYPDMYTYESNICNQHGAITFPSTSEMSITDLCSMALGWWYARGASAPRAEFQVYQSISLCLRPLGDKSICDRIEMRSTQRCTILICIDCRRPEIMCKWMSEWVWIWVWVWVYRVWVWKACNANVIAIFMRQPNSNSNNNHKRSLLL